MKKLSRLNIDALKEANPVLGAIEQRVITGGSGAEESFLTCISLITGLDQNTVRDLYSEYLTHINGPGMEYGCGGMYGCGDENSMLQYWQEYTSTYGVMDEHITWLMTQNEYNRINLPEVNCIMICRTEVGGVDLYNAVEVTYIDNNCIRYADLQCGGEGFLYKISDGSYSDSGGNIVVNIHALYRQ